MSRDAAVQMCATYKAERDASKAERNDMKAALAKYSPEVINRQAELLLLSEQFLGEVPSHLPVTLDVAQDPMMRMRQELCYLGVRRDPRSHMLDGATRFNQFRTWLKQRPIVDAAEEYAGGSTSVFAGTRMPALSRTASRLCKATPWFIQEFVTWCTKPFFHGIHICPDYIHGSTPTYPQPTWSRSDQWRACGEQERELFYLKDGRITYAGTYVCHTGPGQLRIHHLGKIWTEALLDDIVRSTYKSGYAFAECNAICELYKEGTLTVHALGLERVGFNIPLHRALTDGLRLRSAAGTASGNTNVGTKTGKKTRRGKRGGKAVAAHHQLHPSKQSLSTNPAPFVPASTSFNPASYIAQTPSTSNSWPSSHPCVPPPHPPAPPTLSMFPRAPSELEYAAQEEYNRYEGAVKHEREEGELGYVDDDRRKHKIAKVKEEEEERWIEDEVLYSSHNPVEHAETYDEDDVCRKVHIG